ncbi:hypothetical protein [Niveibacterium terrae]|uniref:hypothetical protein n=1 Tax=Niveibacterium terrae TaxID=3373598 RepID=UPI003A8E2C66
MKRTAMLVVLFLACVASPLALAARTGTMFEMAPVSVAASAKTPLTVEQVRSAIAAGSAVNGWTVKSEEPGKIVLALDKGKYYVELNVPYSATEYKIEYVKSEGLKYSDKGDGVATIHQGYFRWIGNLMHAINAVLATTGSAPQ